jgi:hypothetical protein
METIQGLRSFIADYHLRLGPAIAFGHIFTIKDAEATASGHKMCSPEGKPVFQMYHTEDGETYYPNETARASVDSDGTYHLLSEEELDAAGETKLTNNELNLTVHEAAVLDTLIPSNTSYVFEPGRKMGKVWKMDDPANLDWYRFLVTATQIKDLCLLGVGVVKGYEGLYRLTTWGPNLVMQRYCFPNEIHSEIPTDGTPEGLRGAKKTKVVSLVKSMVSEYDAANYRNMQKERVKAVGVTERPTAKDIALSVPHQPDMLAAIEEFERMNK